MLQEDMLGSSVAARALGEELSGFVSLSFFYCRGLKNHDEQR